MPDDKTLHNLRCGNLNSYTRFAIVSSLLITPAMTVLNKQVAHLPTVSRGGVKAQEVHEDAWGGTFQDK
jgi:hypothetical protein